MVFTVQSERERDRTSKSIYKLSKKILLINNFDFVNFRKRGSRERDRESDRARSHDRRHRKPEREQRHLERPGGGHKGQERPQIKERRTSDPSAGARGRHSSSHRPNAASRISRSPPDQQPRKPQNQQAKQQPIPLRDKR